MSDQDDIIEGPQDVAEENVPDNFLIDILTGNKESASAKKLLMQKVLHHPIECYGFDGNDLDVNYNPQIPGQGRKRTDIAIFRPNVKHNNDNLQRIVVCKNQKKRDRLRSTAEADLRELKDLQELINTEHPEYKVFMAVVDRAGVDARGNLLFQRAPDGEELVFDEEVTERVREGGEVEIRRTTRRNHRVHDELPLVAEKYKEFRATGEVTL